MKKIKMSKNIQKIISVTTSIATMAVMSGIGMLAPLAASAATINEGDTIRVADNPDVYIAKYVGAKKFKRLILNPQVFESYGHLSWDNIKIVSQAEMDAFTTSELVRALGDSKVYKLIPNGDIGTKQWMNMSAEAFASAGNDWDSIYVINDTDRDNYTTGSDLTDGSTPVTGGSVSVSLASDTAAAGVAVGGAARVPFTKVNFTTGSSAVSITGLTIQRTGLADDLAFSSITLVDNQTNLLVGLAQTLNSSHQVSIIETITIPANTTQSYTISGNMASAATILASYAGQVASLSLVGITTTATVSGTLPLTGNGQTLNGNLSIGSATITAGSLDPGVAADKNVGTVGYTFSSMKITAGSAEDVTVYSIKWNQSGSAATSDLANIVVSDGTTNYATTVSSDGKYYTASFGTSGIAITKGLNKEFNIKGDILSGSARTVAFDIYRNTDVMVKGNLYGYYLTPAFTANSATHSGATTPTTIQEAIPYFQGPHVTIGSGSLRVDKSNTGAPATNITRGATGQVLGAFDFVVLGESVNVTSIRLDMDKTGVGSSTDITSFSLNKADGTVLATGGTAVDSALTSFTTLDGSEEGYVTFSGTITFPVGTTQVIVKGNLNTDFVAADTFRVGFANTGVGTNVTGITGQTTGKSLTATPATAVWGNTMTIKGGSLTANISGSPVSQTVIAGATNFVFANIILDAGASGEDVRVTQILLNNYYDTATDVFGVQLFDGATALTTGSNVVTPDDTSSPDSNTFTLDTPLVIAKGTSKTLAVKGNVLASATSGNTQKWGFDAGTTFVVATGKDTGQTITVTTTAQTGPTMTIATSGQYSVALDSSTPSARLIAAFTQGNIMTTLRFRATSEQITITKLSLGLNGNASTTVASSTANDIAKVYIYDGSTLLNAGGNVLGISNAVGGSANATSTITLTTPLVLPANTDKTVTIKADIDSMENTTNPAAIAGHRVAIDFYGGTTSTYNEATGASSGASILNYSASTAQTAAYIYRSVPTVSKMALSSNTLSAGTIPLYKFKVTADANGDIDLYKFTFQFATSSATLGALTLYDVTTSNEVVIQNDKNAGDYNPIGGSSASLIDVDMVLELNDSAATVTVPAGQSKIFELRGAVSGTIAAGSSVVTQLQGDAASAQSGAAQNGSLFMLPASTIDGNVNDDFIWSDKSAASHTASTNDWANGYLVSGLPSTNLASENVSK